MITVDLNKAMQYSEDLHTAMHGYVGPHNVTHDYTGPQEVVHSCTGPLPLHVCVCDGGAGWSEVSPAPGTTTVTSV